MILPVSSTSAVAPRRSSETSVEKVWQEYHATGEDRWRNLLIEHYLPLVKYAAERIHSKLPDQVDVDDLMSAGVFGLMDAIDGFDEHRGIKFETYAPLRIRGAILDELRSMDWVPRLVRSRSSQVDDARRRFREEFGRPPTEEEVARLMGLSPEEYNTVRKDVAVVGVGSLSFKLYETDSDKGVYRGDVLPGSDQADPLLRGVQRQDLMEMVTKGLSRVERLIIILYYCEEMTMADIGEVIDLTESRVSQLHKSILDRLKVKLFHRRDELEDK
ncbi:MAG: FliA/WhiG family RNA polymerase sigma factor [Candidatus Paceibacterota bacterium]